MESILLDETNESEERALEEIDESEDKALDEIGGVEDELKELLLAEDPSIFSNSSGLVESTFKHPAKTVIMITMARIREYRCGSIIRLHPPNQIFIEKSYLNLICKCDTGTKHER